VLRVGAQLQRREPRAYDRCVTCTITGSLCCGIAPLAAWLLLLLLFTRAWPCLAPAAGLALLAALVSGPVLVCVQPALLHGGTARVTRRAWLLGACTAPAVVACDLGALYALSPARSACADAAASLPYGLAAARAAAVAALLIRCAGYSALLSAWRCPIVAPMSGLGGGDFDEPEVPADEETPPQTRAFLLGAPAPAGGGSAPAIAAAPSNPWRSLSGN